VTTEAHHRVSEDNPKKLRRIVIGLAVLYVMTFLGGFLQDTPFNFVNFIFFFLLFIGGIALIRVTVKSEGMGMTKWILFLTGISTTLLFIFFTGYELLRPGGYKDVVDSIEAYLYLTTLIFWILVITSLVSIRRIRRRNSLQS
jgi:hypothetical protein